MLLLLNFLLSLLHVSGQQLTNQEKEKVNSCLMPCRLIAIKCVIEGADANDLIGLMTCVDGHAQPENFQNIPNRNPKQCHECIQGLYDSGIKSFEERAKDLQDDGLVPCINETTYKQCLKFVNCEWHDLQGCKIKQKIDGGGRPLKQYKKQPCGNKDDKPAQCNAREDCRYDDDSEKCVPSTTDENQTTVELINFDGSALKFEKWCNQQNYNNREDCKKCGGRLVEKDNGKNYCRISKKRPNCNKLKGSVQICLSVGCTWNKKKNKCKGISNLVKNNKGKRKGGRR